MKVKESDKEAILSVNVSFFGLELIYFFIYFNITFQLCRDLTLSTLNKNKKREISFFK